MDSLPRRAQMAAHATEFTVPSSDRFARTDGRPRHQIAPLTRKIEVASLLQDFSFFDGTVSVPSTPVFDACCAAFAHGTLVRTDMGDTAIEDLCLGDRIETSCGVQSVLWIGATQWRARDVDSALFRVVSGALAPGKPAQDGLFGPAAHMRHAPSDLVDLWGDDGVLSPLSDFENGDSVIAVRPPAPVRLFHIAFKRHATFHAGGIEVESYHPGHSLRDQVTPETEAHLLKVFPHVRSLGGFGPMYLPRVPRNARGGFSI